mmetsp:Transcript_57286/g.166215  ORF Transcript_57286/g.166215 Transcript_57286/m.166215 type:complete len:266 (-) Transcript_57286:40-837(-)
MGQVKSCIVRDNRRQPDPNWPFDFDSFVARAPGARVMPYGVLGNNNLAKRVGAVAPEPDDEMVILDPAGMHHIRGGPSNASGAAGAIYAWLGIDADDSFPKPVIEAVTEPLKAKYHSYGGKHCIHVVGFDFRTRNMNKQEAIEVLTEAYGNVLMEFCTTGKKTLRLLPISGGIFSGYWGQSMAQFSTITAEALERAYWFLPPDKQHLVDEAKLEMCIFMTDEVPFFEKAFFGLDTAPKDFWSKPACAPPPCLGRDLRRQAPAHVG